jgi:hypothetical protein
MATAVVHLFEPSHEHMFALADVFPSGVGFTSYESFIHLDGFVGQDHRVVRSQEDAVRLKVERRIGLECDRAGRVDAMVPAGAAVVAVSWIPEPVCWSHGAPRHVSRIGQVRKVSRLRRR